MGFRPVSEEEIAPTVTTGFRPVALEEIAVEQPKLTAGETFAGGMSDILNKLTFGGAGEIVGGGRAILDDLTGNGTPEGTYAQRKAEVDSLISRYGEQNPFSSAINNIAGFLAPVLAISKTPGVAGAIKTVGSNAAASSGISGAQEFLTQDGTVLERLQGVPSAMTVGAAIGAGAGAGGRIIDNLATPAGEALQLSTTGVRLSDLRNARKPLNKSLGNAQTENPLMSSFKRIKEAGGFRNGLDASDIKETLEGQSSKLNDEVNSILGAADEVAADVSLPAFDKTKKFVFDQKGKDFKDAYKIYKEEVNDLIDTLDNGGTLLDWQAAKKAAQKQVNYNTENSQVRNDVRSRIASDIRQHLEDETGRLLPGAAGQLKGLNQQLGDRAKFGKILNRELDEDPNKINAIRSLMKTTGGFGVPILGALVGGGAGYSQDGNIMDALKVAAAGAAVGSKRGRWALGEGLMGLGNAATKAGVVGLPAFNVATQESPTEMAAPLNMSNFPQPSVTQGSTVMPKADDIDLDALPTKKADRMSYVENLIDSDPVDATIYKIESSRNPDAKNPESTASGAFQLLKGTAKKLGVKNVFDIGENYKGYLKLKEENQGVLKSLGLDEDDGELLYSLHYLGAPTFKKWVRGQNLPPDQERHVKYLEEKVLPKFRKVYTKEQERLMEV